MQEDREIKIPIVYSSAYYVDIASHVFPTSKYRILEQRICSENSLNARVEFIAPPAATVEEILSVHSKEYIDKLKKGTLTKEEELIMEVPYSPALVEASFISCGGTLTAARWSLKRKMAVHLGGGFHHAFSDHGEGFCVLNDIAVTIRVLQKELIIRKALVIDCDLHQGNGTAFIFAGDESVFTFSIHQEDNYPFNKPKSSMDIGLNSYARDDEYLSHLYDNIPKIISTFKPEIILYLAGADPYENDQLGALRISKKGLRERDNFIYAQARNFGVPIAVTLAGGYAFDRRDTIDIHFATVEECVKVFSGG